MKILLIHRDKQKWATQQRAEALKKCWKDDEVDITDAWHLPDGKDYDVIHILFSGGITRIRNFIIKNKHKTFTTLASERTLKGYWDDYDKLKEVYQKCKGIVCLNLKLIDDLIYLIGGEYVNKVHYIPNGVNEKLFNRKFVVGFVGATEDHKGYSLIEKACKDLDLWLAKAKNIPHEKMPEFYENIDCLVIPSENEGCNNPTLEALAMNKPVISTRTGIVEDLKGVILIERNVESIKEALRKLSGRLQILEDYTWEKIASQYRQIYVEK